MNNDNMDKTMKGMMAIMMIAILGTAAVSLTAQAAPEPGQYCDPFNPDVCFNTYDELEQYFQTNYPTTPIDIIWE